MSSNFLAVIYFLLSFYVSADFSRVFHICCCIVTRSHHGNGTSTGPLTCYLERVCYCSTLELHEFSFMVPGNLLDRGNLFLSYSLLLKLNWTHCFLFCHRQIRVYSSLHKIDLTLMISHEQAVLTTVCAACTT